MQRSPHAASPTFCSLKSGPTTPAPATHLTTSTTDDRRPRPNWDICGVITSLINSVKSHPSAGFVIAASSALPQSARRHPPLPPLPPPTSCLLLYIRLSPPLVASSTITWLSCGLYPRCCLVLFPCPGLALATVHTAPLSSIIPSSPRFVRLELSWDHLHL
jgi:hypothetical protein